MVNHTDQAHYTNPILDADWPDPDVVRVGTDFYLIASSFNRSPGLPILHSTDMVNWTIINYALQELPPEQHFTLPRHGQGVWAPSIRYHDGLFYIAFPDPDHGIYITTATDPAGEWSTPHLLLEGSGLIDPCPLWDEDGRTYLVFGWANSRIGQKNLLSVVETSADLTTQLGPIRTVIDGDEIPDCITLEGPKFHKYRDYYWIFAPAGGVATGWQYAFRSKNPYGPYEERIVMRQGETPVNGPHQGAWVDTPTGQNWFFHFQDRGVFGRVVHLQPMVWNDDDWPVIGHVIPQDPTCGQPVLSNPYPQVSKEPTPPATQREPQKSDDFSGEVGKQWFFQANRPAGTATAHQGYVHLPISTNDFGNLRNVGDVFTQQLPGYPVQISTSIRIPATQNGRAGLIVLGQEYGWVGVEISDGAAHLVVQKRTEPSPRLPETNLMEPVALPSGTGEVFLKISSDESATIEFSWRTSPDDEWTTAPQTFQAVRGQWIGADVGLFATSYTDPSGKDHSAEFGPVIFKDATSGERI